MTAAQAAQTLVALGATFVKRDAAQVEWWRLSTGEWVGKRDAGNGMVEMRKFAANACGC